MQYSTTKNKSGLIGTADIITEAFSIYKEKLSSYVYIAAIPAILSALMFAAAMVIEKTESISFADGFNTLGFIGIIGILSLVVIVIGILASIAMLLLTSGVEKERILSLSTTKLLVVIGVQILYMLIVAGGLILLIIPGIIFGIWYSFAWMAVILENKSATEALKTSKSYIRGKEFAVIGRCILIGLLVGIASSIFNGIGAFIDLTTGASFFATITQLIFSLFSMPFSVIVYYIIYMGLRELHYAQSQTPVVENVQPNTPAPTVQNDQLNS